jgi:hypothetical protein
MAPGLDQAQGQPKPMSLSDFGFETAQRRARLRYLLQMGLVAVALAGGTA